MNPAEALIRFDKKPRDCSSRLQPLDEREQRQELIIFETTLLCSPVVDDRERENVIAEKTGNGKEGLKGELLGEENNLKRKIKVSTGDYEVWKLYIMFFENNYMNIFVFWVETATALQLILAM